jgi:hypothetical protein
VSYACAEVAATDDETVANFRRAPEALLIAVAAIKRDVAGAVSVFAAIFVVSEFPAAAAAIENVIVAFDVAPTRDGEIAPTVIELAVRAVAFAGTVETMPRPKAATATSAMRLKVVFVDICFLSISRTEEFPQFGLN